MNIKLLCNCGTKFAFEIEPVEGRMPFTVTCPNCGLDATEFANQYITQMLAPVSTETAPAGVPPTAEAPPAGRIHLNVKAPASPETAPANSELGATLAGVAPVSGGEGLKLGLKKKKDAAPEPATSPETAPANSELGATLSGVAPVSEAGLKLGLKKKKAAESGPATAPDSGTPAAEEASAAAFEAKRGERLAELQRKRDLDNTLWRKTARIGWAIGFAVVALIAAYLWYYFVGSRPADYYEVRLQGEGYGAQAKLLSPDELLVFDDGGVALHNLKEGNTVWTTPLKAAAESESAGIGRRGRFFFRGHGGGENGLHVTDTDIWALSGNRLLQLDRASGAQKKEFPLKGSVARFTPVEGALFVVCALNETRSEVTRIDLASGEAKTEEVSAAAAQRTRAASQNRGSKAPTQGNLLAEELGLKGDLSLAKYRSELVPAGANLARVEVKLLQEKVVSVKAMKDAGESKLNAKTSAASNPMALAEEISNELKRAGGDAYKEVDESSYEVTLNRLMTSGAASWTGKTVGPTAFYPMKTVDVVVGSKEIFLLDKNNKLLKQDKLAYPVSDEYAGEFSQPGAAPCLELDNRLFFYDQGELLAFDLPSGEVRWRLNSVGISRIEPDEDGHLYVNTTTATPDSIQYSEQVSLTDRPRPVVLKVDRESGKILWQRQDAGHACYLSGKFLFSTRVRSATPVSPFAPMEGSDSLWIYRLNPRNGRVEWDHLCKPAPVSLEFLKNRILLRQQEVVRVLKFLSL